MHEFEFIQFIQKAQANFPVESKYVDFGVGDDCAVLNIPDSHQLLVSTDTLVDQVHFDEKLSAHAIGHKSLAVNLSDIAAMGGEPIAVTLNLTLPDINQNWINEFLAGFLSLAQNSHVVLIGGDTTKGPLSITVTAHGLVEKGQALKRSAAEIGDKVYVSGPLGEAAYCLNHPLANGDALHYPRPEILLGKALNGLANAVIDLSDGLASDLNHILKASNKGAVLFAEKLPLGEQLSSCSDKSDVLNYVLSGGDDYKLCFTVPVSKESKCQALMSRFPEIVCVGYITAEKEFVLEKSNGERQAITSTGYNHFI